MATQELASSFKTGDGSDSNHSPYGSTKGDDVVIQKQSSTCGAKCCLTFLPLIFSIAAVVISVIVLIELHENNDNQAATTTSIGHLSRNLILQQFAFEQRLRSQGDSGITNVRQHFDGDADYDDGTYSNGASIAIHDHADFINICGMGEIQAVLNGVEFQTRHNDYSLNMPSTTSTEYGAVEPLPIPEVPPEVLNAGDVEAQIAELQEWFRAFKTQNKSHRYYPDYFKPVLCYLEGTWIVDDNTLEEPFDSDRHELDASTWKELHDKIRWMVNSGRKDPLENLAQLPSSIRNLIDDTYPIVSNWEYRILCAPLKNDVPLDRFRVNDDLSVQLLMSPLTREELYYSRRARFDMSKYINLSDPDSEESYPFGYWQPGVKMWNYLDYLMEQIPGKDNYMANLTDELPDGTERVIHFNDRNALNSGFYNRFYGLTGFDAMGATGHRRGYSDRYLFAAKTTQEKVSPIGMDWTDNTDGSTIRVESRWSYAIPLEIVYLTPIRSWNPYNVSYIELEFPYNIFDPFGKTGLCEKNDSFPGWTDFAAYYTPAEFYEQMGEKTGADTAKSDICVLGGNNVSYPVFASGQYITTPKIGGDVGWVRTRFPIFPVHGAGSPAFKEVKAFQDVALDDDYDDPVNGVPFFGPMDERDRIYGFDVFVWGGGHEHYMHIPGWKVNYYWYNNTNQQYYNGSEYQMIADTSIANGHEHTIISYRYRSDENSTWNYVMEQCAFGKENDHGNFTDAVCQDGHNALIRGFT